MSAYPICGDCLPCRSLTSRLLRMRRRPSLLLEPRPTVAGLEKHAARFGPEQVPETAAEYGLSVAVERSPARRVSSGGPTLRQRVATLVADGHGVDVVAEMEDLSPARARRLVAEVKEHS